MNNKMIEVLQSTIEEIIKLDGVNRFFPQVGSNIVYSREEAETSEDVAALTGRMIKTIKGPIACGEVVYGASRYLASVVLAARRLDSDIRVAINLKTDKEVTKKLKKAGLNTITIPIETTEGICPVTSFINGSTELYDAYIHPGDFGVEATTTIISKTPKEILEILRVMLKFD